jgi:hypothetical protein
MNVRGELTMLHMIAGMRDRVKGRIGVYGAGFDPESVMGLLLPFVVVGIMAFMGWLLVSVLK